MMETPSVMFSVEGHFAIYVPWVASGHYLMCRKKKSLLANLPGSGGMKVQANVENVHVNECRVNATQRIGVYRRYEGLVELPRDEVREPPRFVDLTDRVGH